MEGLLTSVDSYRLAVESVREADEVWTLEEDGRGPVRRMDAPGGAPESLIEAEALSLDEGRTERRDPRKLRASADRIVCDPGVFRPSSSRPPCR